MGQFVNQILQWPIIVQGALGSCLFWLTLVIGEKAFRLSSSKYLVYSKRTLLERLQAEVIRYAALIADDKSKGSYYIVALLYMALHNIVKALISACLGVVLNTFIPTFGIIGFLFSLYYLFKASHIVRDTEEGIDKKARLKNIMSEVDSLKKELQKK